MKNKLYIIVILFCSLLPCSVISQNNVDPRPEPQWTPSRFQLAGGTVTSNIDLNRYVNGEVYRGLQGRIIAHLTGILFLSAEYSTFPVHKALPAWDDIHTHKYDLNLQFSYATENKRTRIFTFLGLDRHEWTARFTGMNSIDQLTNGIATGNYATVKRWGMNVGCGISHELYDNIGIIADARFNVSPSDYKPSLRIMDVLYTVGISFSLPQIPNSNKIKTAALGKKLYKWTETGGQ